MDRCLFLGELGLDGTLCHTNGILPMVALAREHGITTVFVPAVDAQEAALVEGVTIIPVEHLAALVGHLREGIHACHRYSSGRNSPAGGAGTRPYLTQNGFPREILNT